MLVSEGLDVEELHIGRVSAKLLPYHSPRPPCWVLPVEEHGPWEAPFPRPALGAHPLDEQQLFPPPHQCERGDVRELFRLRAVRLRNQSRGLRRTHQLWGLRPGYKRCLGKVFRRKMEESSGTKMHFAFERPEGFDSDERISVSIPLRRMPRRIRFDGGA